jgi:C_GCAxxG_C_C family probable redox protein
LNTKEIGRKALEYDKYSGCSQSVLLALQEAFEMFDMESFKAATVLSGGIARRGETCGAYIGGLLALGQAIGRENIEDTQSYRDAMKPANEIRKNFLSQIQKVFNSTERLNSTLCRDIQKIVYGRSFDLNDPEDYQAFLGAGGHSDTGCPLVCSIAAEVTAKKLIELLA